MRMWMVEPKIMCRRHLIGEYRELFTFLGTLKKGISIKGYIENDLLEPLSLESRYLELKKEMLLRGYNPAKTFEISNGKLSNLNDNELKHIIDREKSLFELLNRCDECKSRYNALIKENIKMKGGIEKWE